MEDEAGVAPRPLLLCVLPERCCEELITHPLCVSNQHAILTALKSIQLAEEEPTD